MMMYTKNLCIFSDDSSNEGDNSISSNQLYIETNKDNTSRDLSHSVTEINGINLFSNEYKENSMFIDEGIQASELKFKDNMFYGNGFENESFEEVTKTLFVSKDINAKYNKNDETRDYFGNFTIWLIIFSVICIVVLFVYLIDFIKREKNKKAFSEENAKY